MVNTFPSLPTISSAWSLESDALAIQSTFTMMHDFEIDIDSNFSEDVSIERNMVSDANSKKFAEEMDTKKL